MKKILVLGITSIIGYRFYQKNKEKYDLYGLCRKWPLDYSDKILSMKHFDFNVIKEFIYQTNPDVVINCIGVNDVEKCELDPDASEKLNIGLVEFLVTTLNELNIKMVSFSSSHVFSGISREYFENSNALPINHYGRQKLYSDNYIEKYSENYLLLRLTSVIACRNSFQRNNLSNYIVDTLSQKKMLTLVHDECTNFIYVDDVVNVIVLLFENASKGVFNVAGDEMLSRYELGLIIMKKMKLKNFINKISSSDYSMGAERPKNLVLNNSKLKNEIGYSFKSISSCITNLIESKEGL